MTFLQKSPRKFTKTLTHSMYIIRKTGTLKTQCVHGMRLPKILPLVSAPEFQVIEHQFYQDPDTFDEPDFFQIHNRTNTPRSDKPPDEETDHDKEDPQEFSTQVQLAPFQHRRQWFPRWRCQQFRRSLWNSSDTPRGLTYKYTSNTRGWILTNQLLKSSTWTSRDKIIPDHQGSLPTPGNGNNKAHEQDPARTHATCCNVHFTGIS